MPGCRRYMEAEDRQTNFVCIGPVNKVMNMLCAWHAAGGSSQAQGGTGAGGTGGTGTGGAAAASQRARQASTWKRHVLRVPDYLWLAEDGMKVCKSAGQPCVLERLIYILITSPVFLPLSRHPHDPPAPPAPAGLFC